jgi:hypothetical protein
MMIIEFVDPAICFLASSIIAVAFTSCGTYLGMSLRIWVFAFRIGSPVTLLTNKLESFIEMNTWSDINPLDTDNGF